MVQKYGKCHLINCNLVLVSLIYEFQAEVEHKLHMLCIYVYCILMLSGNFYINFQINILKF